MWSVCVCVCTYIYIKKSSYTQNTLLGSDEDKRPRSHAAILLCCPLGGYCLAGPQAGVLPSPGPVHTHLTKDLVHGSVRGQRAVKYRELPLEPLGYVVAPAPGMDHGCQNLQVHDAGELPRFLQVIKALLFHQLSYDLVSNLRKTTFRVKTSLFYIPETNSLSASQ